MKFARIILAVGLGAIGAFFLRPGFLGGSLFEVEYIAPAVTAQEKSRAPSVHLPIVEEKVDPAPKQIVQGEQPEITGWSGIVMDAESKVVLWEKNPDDVHPIASISKLATLTVALKETPDWESVYALTAEENALEGARLSVPNGEEVIFQDIFRATIIGSANNAASAISHIFGPEKKFVKKMNKLAENLGLTHTTFEEPTGLSPNNLSTAREVALLANRAFQSGRVTKPARMIEYDLVTVSTERAHTVKNTNKLLGESKHEIIAGKTGYTEEAGFCVVTKALIQGHEVIVVVLGSERPETRFDETETLLDYVDAHFAWPDGERETALEHYDI